MIPYDDLVAALASWRARQGLPVAELTPLAPTASEMDMVGMAAMETHSTPPPPPPARGAEPLPLEPGDEEVDASALLETHYENEGDDFAMSFDNAAAEQVPEQDESTTIGSPPPPRDSFSGGGTEPEPEPAFDPNNRNDDW